MTTDQDNRRVFGAYRELARETTPAELDERILAMAARDTQSRYGLARVWIRPVAWAAMIGISLVFMLEMTRFTDAPLEDGAPQPPVAEERMRQDAQAGKARHPDSPGESIGEPEAAALVVEDASLPDSAAKRALLPAASERREAAAASSDTMEAERFCDSDARASAGDWYECIRQLREQGLVEEAAEELEALVRAFPDFRESATE
jgi:hypothetical protein